MWQHCPSGAEARQPPPRARATAGNEMAESASNIQQYKE
jgi:hypothetical protein